MALPEDIKRIKQIPTAFVIFGASGDLSRKKIFPSFYELSKQNLLPEKFKIVACARSQFTSGAFATSLKENIAKAQATSWDKFAKLIEYVPCDIARGINLEKVEEALDSYEKTVGVCVMRIFYAAVSPMIYEKTFENLGKHGLNLGCRVHGTKSRIVIEKPFGYDWQSAQKLNRKLNQYFGEEQIFRIDHFLGKETVQNIFAFRFGNEIFEPVWNRQYVDHVQITLAEHVGIEKRGEYYDKMGALRDVVQNHILQLLTLVTMEQPARFDRPSIRQRKLEVLGALKKQTPQETVQSTVRGQYEDYLKEEKVNPASQTETYALVKLFIENRRWQGVPFYLRTGKRLVGKVSSIIFSFKEKGHAIFENFWDKPMPNHITLQIEPDEGIGLRLVAKKPGLVPALGHVDMEFCYRTSFEAPQPNAYERLLIDIIAGDQTLFLGQIGPSWQFIDPIREAWDRGKPKLSIYKPGSWGPKEADDLIKQDGREWLAP
ncbi:glucose-6-phosphate dehydrogenase, partial [Candidatus Curtissbacteria bacterium]|nr:glucose-6-phosphate dehydrogenase [Candidatus Curtissbacteria bacterium]